MKPTSINANRERKEMIVLWDDGHKSIYPFSLFRAGCPCADCRGGHDRMGILPDPAVFKTQLPDSPATDLITINPVGAYAISPAWGDGHDSGIYRWDYLRALCPCKQCQRDYYRDPAK